MFIEIAEAHPRFLRRQLPQVVDAMLQVGPCVGWWCVCSMCVYRESEGVFGSG